MSNYSKCFIYGAQLTSQFIAEYQSGKQITQSGILVKSTVTPTIRTLSHVLWNQSFIPVLTESVPLS
jgi:hypothetical protein